MSNVQECINVIKTQLIGNRSVRALIVEGPEDVDAFQQFLNRRTPGWESKWIIAEAGGKRPLLQILKKEPDWVGIADRDDWSADELSDHAISHPNLFVLPRFCLESYLIDPDELWTAFPEKQRDKLAGGVADLKAALVPLLPNWTRHAALWHVINPLWRRLRHLGFVDGVLDTKSIPDDKELTRLLKSWAVALDVQKTLQEFSARLTSLHAMPTTDLFATWIQAKRFYPEVVHPALDRLLGSKSAKERRLAIFRTLPVPVDLEGLWQKMGLVP